MPPHPPRLDRVKPCKSAKVNVSLVKLALALATNIHGLPQVCVDLRHLVWLCADLHGLTLTLR